MHINLADAEPARKVLSVPGVAAAQATDPGQLLESTLPLDIRRAFEETPPPLDFVVQGLKAGTVAILASPGGVGKSFTALELAMGVAAPGVDTQLLNLGITSHGRVVMLNAEDPLDVLQQRIHAIGRFLDDGAREGVQEQMTIKSLRGARPNLLDPKWVDAISRCCEGARLLVIDTLSRFHTGDENSNAEMGQVISHAELITERTGTSILALHHTSKAATLNGQQSAQQSTRGASALVDNARWQSYLEVMSLKEANEHLVPDALRSHFVTFGIAKQNYGRPVAPRWLVKLDQGVLVHVTPGREMAEALEHIEATIQSEQTPNGLLRQQAANDERVATAQSVPRLW